MKSPGTFEISVSWWRRECDADLQKDPAAKRFETLLKEFEQALSKVRRGTDAQGLSEIKKAGESLQTAAKPVAKVAETMAKSGGDKRKPLENTAAALDRPLAKALEVAIAQIEVNDADEDEDDDSQFGSAAAHADYLAKRLRKVKQGQMNFAVTMSGNDPSALRMSFHKRKSGQSQAKPLKTLCGGKQTTFGIAGTDDLSEDVTGEQVASGVLVLVLEGKMVPALAKRIKAAFRAMKVKTFKKVRILKDGQVLDEASEDDPDVVLPDLGDEGQDGGNAAPDTAPETSPVGESPETTLKRTLALQVRELSGLIVSQPDKLRQAMTPLLREAAEIIAAAKDDTEPGLARAARILAALQKRIEDGAGESGEQRGSEAKGTIAKGTVDFGKVRLLWANSRSTLRTQIAALVKDIIDACGDDPEYAQWKADARSLLVYAADFDAELEEALGRLDTARTVEDRATFLDEARNLLAEHLEDLEDEFFAIANGSTELPRVDADAAKNALRVIAQIIDRSAREPVGGG